MISWGASVLIRTRCLLVSYWPLAHLFSSNFILCSYDGVLRGPFAFRRSADELKHASSVRSTA